MKKRITALLLCLALAFSVMSVTAFACSDDVTYSVTLTGTITGNDVNLRTGHGTGYDSGGTLNKNDKMAITKYYDAPSYTWFYGTVTYSTKTQNIGSKGWVAGGYNGFIKVR